jgi:two-component system cell cycle sensor histidine kinase/response regulator CckA
MTSIDSNGIGEGIAVRVEAESSTRATEARFRGFVEAAREAIWAIDADGATTYANPRAASLLGYTSAELSRRTIFDFMTVESALVARAAFAQSANAELVELEFIRKDGTTVPTLVAVSPIPDEQETVGGLLAMITDITERKAAENKMADALRTADLERRRLEATLQAIPVGVWIADAAGRMVHSNPSAALIWGGHAPHVAGPDEYTVYRASWSRTRTPLTLEEYPLPRALRTGMMVDWETIDIERFDGTRGHILNSAAPILDADGLLLGGVAVSMDITDRHLAAAERDRLLASLEIERTRLSTVFELAPSFLAVLRGPTYVFERVNRAYETLVGRDVLGKTLREALPEVTHQGYIELLDHVRETGEPFVGKALPVYLTRVPGAVAELRYVDLVYQRVVDPDGEDRVMAHGVDITEQVVAVTALRRTEERLRDQFAKLPVPTFLWEKRADDFVLIDLNDAALLDPRWHGTVGRTATELFPHGWDARADATRCLTDGAVMRRSVTTEWPGHESRTFDLTIGPQPPDRVIVHSVETTEQTRLANELRQSQKMDAVGKLAGGIAHDFNNLLTVIGAHTAFLIEGQVDAGLLETDTPRVDSRAIQQAADRAAELTRQLLAFSRKQIMKPAVIDLNLVVEETDRLLARVLGEDIEVVLTLARDLGRVLADAGQVEQVLMNLVLNARDAMASGGRLSITTCNTTVDADARALRGIVPPGRYATLSVVDTGTGIDEATKAHLFEPFFTTKGVGKGTGLGLSTVHGIVTQSGGYITVASTQGDGATFTVYFPVVSAGGEPKATPDVEAPAAKGIETVLLVEDNPSVRQIAKRILVGEGYQVLEAADGQIALEVSASFDRPIDMVISDAVMPGMTGAAVLDHIRAERPNCKAILMSGYTDDEMTRRGISSKNVTFIQKPFTPANFTRLVRQTLDS